MIQAGSSALITGASGGIGEQFARQLASRKVNLVLVARSEERLNALADELKNAHSGLSATVVAADLSTSDAPTTVTDKLEQAGITVDLLINNAGVGSLGPFVDQDRDAVVRAIQLNCVSLVELTSRLLPSMLTRNQGGVINVASTAAFQPIPTMAVYSASKAFVLFFTEALWAETEDSAVRILALCPGPTQTQFFQTASAEQQFLTRGRQTPDRVVSEALRAFESGRSPSFIPGSVNRTLASSSRFMPRRAMLRAAERSVRPT
jgi:short-subunit dehydrogenase